jgi:SAM-dependent methyltransferase
VGCGYGLNLINWVKKYKRAKFIGIDIDPKGIESANKLFKDEKLSDRVEILEIPIEEYVKRTNTKFDVIMLNQVLHEMDPNENHRIKLLEHIYYLLKDDGLLIIGETMMPDIFNEKTEHLLYDIMHKWIEIIFPSKFYNYKSFRELIDLTSFKKIELIQEEDALKSSSFVPISYFWAIRK